MVTGGQSTSQVCVSDPWHWLYTKTHHLSFKLICKGTSWELWVQCMIRPWQMKHTCTHTLTWPWHVSVCVTWGSCSVQTSCYTRRMDTHMAGRPCGYAHVYAGWSPERTAYHTPQMYTVDGGKQVTMPLQAKGSELDYLMSLKPLTTMMTVVRTSDWE